MRFLHGVGRDEVESYAGLSMSETSQPGLARDFMSKKEERTVCHHCRFLQSLQRWETIAVASASACVSGTIVRVQSLSVSNEHHAGAKRLSHHSVARFRLGNLKIVIFQNKMSHHFSLILFSRRPPRVSWLGAPSCGIKRSFRRI